VLAPYRTILATPHLPVLLVLALCSRLFMTGMPIALTFLVAGWTGSYTVAGLVAAAITVGSGISGPWRGRTMDRRPAHQVLVVSAVGYAVAIGAIAALPARWWYGAPVLALLAGLSLPPGNQASRMLWAKVPDPAAREAVYAADATLTEVLYVIGPILASTLVVVSARVSAATLAAIALVGSLAFAAAIRRSGMAPGAGAGEARAPHAGSVLRTRGMLPLLLTLSLMVAALTAGDMALVAWARNEGMPAMAGVLGALWAIGSGVGGLVIGGRGGRPRLAVRVGAMAANFVVLTPLLPPVLGHSPVWLVGGAALVAGTTIAPAVAAANSRLGAISPAGRQGEAAGWMSTAMTTGGATAAPIVGLLLDHAGPAGATAFGAVAIVAGALLARRVPGRVERPVGVEHGLAVPEAR
jgi:predicted MFS family arabinose efflux permease